MIYICYSDSNRGPKYSPGKIQKQAKICEKVKTSWTTPIIA